MPAARPATCCDPGPAQAPAARRPPSPGTARRFNPADSYRLPRPTTPSVIVISTPRTTLRGAGSCLAGRGVACAGDLGNVGLKVLSQRDGTLCIPLRPSIVIDSHFRAGLVRQRSDPDDRLSGAIVQHARKDLPGPTVLTPKRRSVGKVTRQSREPRLRVVESVATRGGIGESRQRHPPLLFSWPPSRPRPFPVIRRQKEASQQRLTYRFPSCIRVLEEGDDVGIPEGAEQRKVTSK